MHLMRLICLHFVELQFQLVAVGDARTLMDRRRGSTTLSCPRALAKIGCGFFAYSWKLPAYSGAFLLTVDNLSFFTYS